MRAGVPVQSVPYTSKSDHRNGVIGKRHGDWFKGFDGYGCMLTGTLLKLLVNG
ncbi:MAG: hypothetical protein VKL00_01880 [Synechococcales bacterium]|nr:hypothetical protein [Synechococcales bacterium]